MRSALSSSRFSWVALQSSRSPTTEERQATRIRARTKDGSWVPSHTFKHATAAPPRPKRKKCASGFCKTLQNSVFPFGTRNAPVLRGLVTALVGSVQVGRAKEIEPMTVRKLISVASLLGALLIVGCGSSASNVCDNCDFPDNRGACEEFFNSCEGPDCEERALARCADPFL